jgi:dihydroneopterin triphosphate diphosphatase
MVDKRGSTLGKSPFRVNPKVAEMSRRFAAGPPYKQRTASEIHRTARARAPACAPAPWPAARPAHGSNRPPSGRRTAKRVLCPAVPALRLTHVEVYLFQRRPSVRILVLRRSAGRTLPGVWQPVTGKIRRGEEAAAAAAREVFEETSLRPAKWWALETLVTYFDAATDRVNVLPLFAAELGAADRVARSAEHDAHRFVSPRQAASQVLWESQRRAILALEREILGNARLAHALEITSRIPRRFRAPVRPPRRRR